MHIVFAVHVSVVSGSASLDVTHLSDDTSVGRGYALDRVYASVRVRTDIIGTPILIEPKSAFGTGHHATTALCLRVVSDLLEAGRLQQGQHFLDLGTGSGVLGIGCCKFGLTGEGLDIDPLAVDNAVENRALNAIAPENFTVAEGSIDAVTGKQFDLVLANILARPLTEMAADIVRACRPGGCLVLSGLLEIQADGVTAAYKAQGLPEPRRIIDGEWAALVWDSVK